MEHRTIVRVGDDWLEVRPYQVWAEIHQDGTREQFRVVSVSSDRANVFWPYSRIGMQRGVKRLSAFRSCELIEDVEKEGVEK